MKSNSFSFTLKASNYWTKLVGVRWQLLLAVVMLWVTDRWLQDEYGRDDSNLWLVMNQFIHLILWTIVGLFVMSLLSAIFAWIYFLNGVKNNSISIQAKFGDGQKVETDWVSFTVQIIGPVLRPFLGTVQARMVFAEKKISDRVVLDTNVAKPYHWWRQGIRGTGQTLLHDRKIYDVEKVLISFCDMFGLVSLPGLQPFSQQVYTLPRTQSAALIKAQPNSTEEQKQRIDIPQRVEGEHVNYKEFETGDNINRIVWKIYAKSGQLVVRIPETKDPYTSHVYFYVSYFHGLHRQEVFETELLNVYKDNVRKLFEALKKNENEVRMEQDQEAPKLSGMNEKKNELFSITAAAWQNQLVPSAFVKYEKAALVCLSSLVPVEEVEIILRRLPPAVPVVVVKLSNAIPSPFSISLKDVFFKPENQPTDALRQPWLLSSLKKTMIENENKIAVALRRRGNSWLTDDIRT